MKVVLLPEQFARLQVLLARAAGLVFDESRRSSMAYSIAERLRATGTKDVDTYLDRLSDPVERQRLLDEVTIQETHFFRNPPQIRALRQHVLPDLLRYAEAHGRRLRIWSAGCSTGEEPYSIAMILRELLPSTVGWDIKIVATDLSERALEAARSGCYGSRAVQMATPDELGRFFTPLPDAQHCVRPEVRELVEFAHHNLVTEPVPLAPAEHFDLILCRNVTIYFARDTTRALMARLHTSLRDGGYLFLGHSETLWQLSDDFRLVALGAGDAAAFVYRRHDPLADRRAVLPDRRTAPAPVRTAVAPDRRGAPRREAAPAQVTAAPAPTVEALVAGARAALAAGDYTAAVTLAGTAGKADPLRGEAFYLRGLALVEAGRDSDALVDLRKAVYLQPGSGFSHFLLAGVLERLGDRPAAAREYAAAADTLGNQATDAAAVELGGRSIRELAELCRSLGTQRYAEEVR